MSTHPMSILEEFGKTVDLVAGMKAQLMSKGFTEEQAGEIVVIAIKQSMINSAKEDDPNLKPHSRACGIQAHKHGPACSSDCPTCGGKR